MSLINKVLSDLESRQRTAANTESAILNGLSAADAGKDGNRSGVASVLQTLLFGGVLAAIGYSFWQAGPVIATRDAQPAVTGDISAAAGQAQASESTPAATPVKSAPATTIKLDYSLNLAELTTGRSRQPAAGDSQADQREQEGKTEPVMRIQDIALTGTGAGFDVILSGAGPITYTTYRLNDPDRVVLELDNARFDGPLPAFDQIAGLRELRYRELPDNTLLIIVESEQPYTYDANHRPEKNGYRLALHLEPAALDPVARVPENAGTRTQADVPADTDLVSSQGEMEVKKSTGRPAADTSRLLNQATRLYEAGQFNDANTAMAKAVAGSPENVTLRSIYASRLLEQNRPAAAARLLEQGLQLKPGAVEWLKIYARILFDSGDEENAINVLLAGRPGVAEDPDYHAFLAALYQRQERHADAVLVYQEVLRVNPGNGIWWMGLAISLEALERTREALQAYQNALTDEQVTPDIARFLQQKIARLKKVLT